MKRFILISMVFICLVFIFIMSSENGSESMSTTIKVSNVINIGSFYMIRKSAHFIEFFILEVFILLMISSFKIIDFKCFILSILFCLLYAISDEVHQLFVIGRSASIIDVLIDYTGSLFGSIFFMLFYYIYNEGFVK